jgi:hypothetical protein
MRRRFVATASAAATAIPLSSAYLREDPIRLPIGPIRAREPDPIREHADDFDYAAYQSASPPQRATAVEPDEIIDTTGLTRGGERRWLQLPSVVPTVSAEIRGEERDVELVCDTLWLDVDRELCVVSWRGGVAVPDRGESVARLAVWLSPMGKTLPLDARLAELQRGALGFALRPGEEPELAHARDDDERQTLQMARYATWSSKAPEPRLTLGEYATITAELGEWPDARARTLDAHRLDEDTWTVEERAWLEKMGQAALDGDATIADQFSKLFVDAQDALASDEERRQSLEEYAEIKVAIDDAEDPGAALGAAKLSIGRWLRMERRWDAAVRADPAVGDRLEQKLAELRAIGGTREPTAP